MVGLGAASRRRRRGKADHIEKRAPAHGDDKCVAVDLRLVNRCLLALPLALLAYYCSPRKWRLGALTVASYLFYGWTNPLFMVLMASSTVVDYLCGLAMVGRLGSRFREPIERRPQVDHAAARHQAKARGAVGHVVGSTRQAEAREVDEVRPEKPKIRCRGTIG